MGSYEVALKFKNTCIEDRGLSPTWSTRGSWAMHKQQGIAVDCCVSEAAFRSPLLR